MFLDSKYVSARRNGSRLVGSGDVARLRRVFTETACTAREEAVQALELSDGELEKIRKAAREKTLSVHTADQRAVDLERVLEGVFSQKTESSIVEA